MSNDMVGRIEFGPSNPVVIPEQVKKKPDKVKDIRPSANLETFNSLMEFMGWKLVECKSVDIVSCKGCRYENECEDGDECKEFGESDDCDEDVKRGM